MKTLIKPILVLSLALLFYVNSMAGTEVEISAASSKKETQSTDENRAQYRNLGLALGIPFGGDTGEGKISGYQAKIKVSQTTLDPIPSLDRKLTVNQETLGASYFSLAGDRSLFAATLAAHLTGDGKATSEVLPVGAVLGSSLFSENLLGIYGAGFTYVYGEGLLLPLLGISWKTSDSTRLVFVLPLSLKFIMNLDEKSQLDFFLKPQGLHSVMDNGGDFSGAKDDLQVRLREVSLGARYRYHFEKNFSAFVEAGLRGHRELTILDGTHKVYDKDLSSTGYVGVGIKYGFGDSKTSPDSEVLNEL